MAVTDTLPISTVELYDRLFTLKDPVAMLQTLFLGSSSTYFDKHALGGMAQVCQGVLEEIDALLATLDQEKEA